MSVINSAAVMAANSELRRQERSSGAAGLLVLVDAEAILRSAVPYIEAGLREQIAAEIYELYGRSAQPSHTTYDEGWKDSNECAARVARGTSPPTSTPEAATEHQREHEKYGTWPCAWASRDFDGCPIFADLAATELQRATEQQQ